MPRQEFKTLDVVRLEVATDPAGLVNLIQNPNGELGGWGWVTPVPGSQMTSLFDAFQWLAFVPAVPTTAGHFLSEAAPVTPGQYVAARWQQACRDGVVYTRGRLEWLDTSGAVVSSSSQTDYLSAGTGDVATGGTVAQLVPVVAPSGAAFVRLRVDVYDSTGGANPTLPLLIRRATMAKAATTIELGEYRANLVPNPSFETNIEGWTPDGAAISRTTTQAAVGSYSLRMEATLGGTMVVRTSRGRSGFPVVGSATYTAQARVRAATTGRPVTLYLQWFNAAGEELAQDGAVEVDGTGSWITVSATGTAPSTAAFGCLRVRVSSVAAGEVHYLDAVMVERSTEVGPYFDSTTPDAGGVDYAAAVQPPQVTVHTNLIPNPSFETNISGWVAYAPWGTPQAMTRETGAPLVGSGLLRTTSASGQQGVGITTPGGTSGMPVTPGKKYALRWAIRVANYGTKNHATYRVAFYDASGNYIPVNGLSADDAFTMATDIAGGTWHELGQTVTAPAGAAYAAVRLGMVRDQGALPAGSPALFDCIGLIEDGDHYTSWFDGSVFGGAPPFGSTVYAWTGTANNSPSTRTTTVNLPYSTAFASNLAYIPPVEWANILGDAQDVKVTRDGLNVGSISGTILSANLDPSVDDLLRPGRRARLAALVDGEWEQILGGKLLEADVTYEHLKNPRVPTTKQARIQFLVVDPTQTAANAGRPEGVPTITDLPYVLEGAGVPWNVNGSGNQVPTATVTAYNENATALDQVALARDTRLGFAWMSRLGVLNAWDRDQIASGAPVLLDEDDYSDIDLSFSTKDAVNEVQITVQSLGADGTTTETVYGPYLDAESIAKWGRYRKDFTVTGLDSTEVDALAASILEAAATPRIRVNSVTIPLTSVDRIEAHALRDLYDEVRVRLDAKGVDEVLRVTGLEHTITTERWMLRLDFADEGGVASPTIQPPVQSGIRPDVGVIELFAGSTPPPGKLLCDGASYAKADYPHLFAVIGYTFGGSGDFFNVPDMTDRFPIGAGTKALGTFDGNASITLTVGQLPPHTHGIPRGSAVGTDSTFARGDTLGATVASGSQGSGDPIDILNPWLSLNFVIRAA